MLLLSEQCCREIIGAERLYILLQQTAGWLGHTFEDIKDMCRGAEVKSGLNLKFSGTAMKTKKDEIEKWTENIKQGGEL